jgi:uncharacterized protein YbcC (UPF0753/DUF2309 family)
MHGPTSGEEPGPRGAPSPELAALKKIIDHAAHLLPTQGPITSFIHHNTLHAFEDLPFDEAAQWGAQLFGCRPYLTVGHYRRELSRGRIRFDELCEVLAGDLGERASEKVLGDCTRLRMRLAMLENPLYYGPTAELVWFVAERGALTRLREDVSAAVRQRLIAETRRWVMRDLRGGDEAARGRSAKKSVRRVPDSLVPVFERFNNPAIESWTDADWEAFTVQALWRICCAGVAGVPPFTPLPPLPVRHRDLLLEATGADADLPVHELLIRFCAAFLDQGLAQWPLPRRDEGFYRAFCALYRQAGGPPAEWMRGLGAELARLEEGSIGPLESIHESLALLGVAEAEWADFLSATLLALRGWAGMVAQIEARGDRVLRPIPVGSLVEFLAARLVLDRLALAHTARAALGFHEPLHALRDVLCRRLEPLPGPSNEQRAFQVFQLAQVVGWAPQQMHLLGPPEWTTLLREVETFSPLERRRVFHLAYEQRFYTQTLDAIALHVPQAPGAAPPRFQVVFCIDEREESIRRHLEELAPEAETFSVAGFYFIPMYYRGEADAHFVPLCPPVMRPRHWVAERALKADEDQPRRTRLRRALGIVGHRVHVSSRDSVRGALLSTALGVLASAPLVARTFFPRLTSRLRRRLGQFLEPPLTRLQLERTEPTPGPEEGRLGFSLDEMADIGERVLRDIGLTSGFARLVLTLGHGSSSLNNPHESAHDCGACGGARGGPNGRAFAQILNDPRVRACLAQRGLVIPRETVFVGGMHNTSSEAVTFYDTDLLPESHRHDFEAVREVFERACDRDAHERSRRFDSAPLTLSFAAARQHVEGRAEDLAQVRPEWGHATNAVSIVGRRALTRGLFLDRRAFLTSYDPSQDDADNTLLCRILEAVFPVCAGINLEYYFSSVDNPGWGSGTKLPHNITALVGVLDGAASDLRTGLPWQMVEIHEPVRLLTVVETTLEAMLGILDRNSGIARLCRNGWCRLAVVHPQTRKVSVYRDGRFHDYQPRASALPRAPSSVDWYRGWRDHLEFAEIEP